MNTPNMATAELLTQVHMNLDKHPRDWMHRSGRLLTDAEVEAVMGATRADLEAARALMEAKAATAQLSADVSRRLKELLSPYWERFPTATVGELRAHMSADEQAAFDELAAMMEATGTGA